MMAVPLFIQRTYGSLPGDVSTAQRTTRCFAQHDIIFNLLQYMVVCLPQRFAEVSELKERNSTTNCSLTVSGVARCCQKRDITASLRLGSVPTTKPQWAKRREASAVPILATPRQDPFHKLPHFGALYSGCTPRAFGALSDCLFHSGDFGNNINSRCFFSVMFVGVFHSYFLR